MIYTVTFNPSLDYIVSVNDFQLGLTNRTDSELILPGGKGINVSTILMNLGIDSTAFGFAAGFTGEEIIREVEAMGIRSDFIKIDSGISRINLKLKILTVRKLTVQAGNKRREDRRTIEETGYFGRGRYSCSCGKHSGVDAGGHVQYDHGTASA